MNRVYPNKEELINYYNKGYTMQEIGQILNMATGKIHKYFHIYNIEVRPKGTKSKFAKEKLSNSQKGNKYRLGTTQSEQTKQKLSILHKKGGIGHKKKRQDGYIYIYFPDHPKSNKEGYIMEHDLIMECYIGRWLNDDEIVHHKNKKRDDNRIENLQLMTFKEHAKLHMIERHTERKMTYK